MLSRGSIKFTPPVNDFFLLKPRPNEKKNIYWQSGFLISYRKIAMEQMRKGRLPMVLRLSVSVYMYSGQHIHTSTQPMTWMWYVCACRCLCVEENTYVGVHVEAREQPQVAQRDCCLPPVNRVPWCLGLTIWLDLLACKCSHPSVSTSATMLSIFHMNSGARTKVPETVSKHFTHCTIFPGPGEPSLLQHPHLY